MQTIEIYRQTDEILFFGFTCRYILHENCDIAYYTYLQAGLTTYYHPSVNVKWFHYYSMQLYQKLAALTGQVSYTSMSVHNEQGMNIMIGNVMTILIK